MSYDVGQPVRVPVSVKDPDGLAADATMAIFVTRPDGTMAPSPTIEHPGVGEYYADITAAVGEYGPWQWQYNATGAVVGVYTGQFFIRPPGPRINSLEEAKKYLNKKMSVTVDDDEIRDLIDGARWVIENIKGAVVPRTIVEYHDGGGQAIHLRVGPVISITEVRETWGVGDQRVVLAEPDPLVNPTDTDYLFDRARRILYRRSGGWGTTWPAGRMAVRATYVAGRTVPEGNIRTASLELIAHIWRLSQVSSSATRTRVDVASIDQFAPSYGVPNRVRELLGAKRAPRLGG